MHINLAVANREYVLTSVSLSRTKTTTRVKHWVSRNGSVLEVPDLCCVRHVLNIGAGRSVVTADGLSVSSGTIWARVDF